MKVVIVVLCEVRCVQRMKGVESVVRVEITREKDVLKVRKYSHKVCIGK